MLNENQWITQVIWIYLLCNINVWRNFLFKGETNTAIHRATALWLKIKIFT